MWQERVDASLRHDLLRSPRRAANAYSSTRKVSASQSSRFTRRCRARTSFSAATSVRCFGPTGDTDALGYAILRATRRVGTIRELRRRVADGRGRLRGRDEPDGEAVIAAKAARPGDYVQTWEEVARYEVVLRVRDLDLAVLPAPSASRSRSCSSRSSAPPTTLGLMSASPLARTSTSPRRPERRGHRCF